MNYENKTISRSKGGSRSVIYRSEFTDSEYEKPEV